MKMAVLAFSDTGHALGKRIQAHFDGAALSRCEGGGLEAWTEAHFVYDALVFIGACGIAVRAIAPHVKSKLTDPAVVVCDEAGRFAISLLSGHVGEANFLAERIAGHIGATPVITTASELYPDERGQNLVLGIGCRRGVAAEVIERTATILLWREKIPLSRVCEIATIDVKRDETGLLLFAEAHKLPLNFYSAEELSSAAGEFSASGRVLQAVGVDNVCERAAVLCGGNGKLILKKTAKNGVTVAVFEKEDADG